VERNRPPARLVVLGGGGLDGGDERLPPLLGALETVVATDSDRP